MRTRRRLRALRGQYAGGQPFPLVGYTISGGTYVALVAGLATTIRLSGRRLPERTSVLDLALVSVAAHKLSRMVAKDSVTSPLRAPFTRYERPAGDAELVEQVRGPRSRTRSRMANERSTDDPQCRP